MEKIPSTDGIDWVKYSCFPHFPQGFPHEGEKARGKPGERVEKPRPAGGKNGVGLPVVLLWPAALGKEVFQQPGTFLVENSADYLWMMVER